MRGISCVLALACFGLVGCGSSKSGSSNNSSSGASNGGGSSSAGSSSTSFSGSSGLMTPPGEAPMAMPIISHGVPAFASNVAIASAATDANDGNPASSWTSASIPASLAYDLSGVPADQRQQVLIAWYAPQSQDFINMVPTDPSKHLPVDYTIEMNMADGGGMPPTDGWMNLTTVTGNNRSTQQLLANINGANWVRMNITKSSDPALVQIDLDVHSAPDGATDSWLFMGDSITVLTTTYAFSDLPSLVNMIDPTRWPAIIPAGIGGTNTMTATDAIADTMMNFPGRFVTLNYGTNDHPDMYEMEGLVQTVIAAGKVPVVPHVSWTADEPYATSDAMINQQIDALYAKYPQIYPGPDFWTIFMNRTDLIPATDIHPNTAGQEVFRQNWAIAMTQQ